MTFIPYLIATCNDCGSNSSAFDGVIFTKSLAWKELSRLGWMRSMPPGDVEMRHWCPQCTKDLKAKSGRVAGAALQLVVLALLVATMARGETATRALPHALPDAPRQTRVSKTEAALAVADLSIRTLDVLSTHALLASPCKCFHEDDPLSPGGGGWMPLLAFQYGMSAAVTGGAHELRRHGHGRLALLLLGADLVSESMAVQHNLRQHETPQPHRLGVSR